MLPPFSTMPRCRKPFLRPAAIILLACAFLFMRFVAAVHQHGETRIYAAFADAQKLRFPAAPYPDTLCASDCPLCEFAALSAAARPNAVSVVMPLAPRLLPPLPVLCRPPLLVRLQTGDDYPARAPPAFLHLTQFLVS